jgi:predicted permease
MAAFAGDELKLEVAGGVEQVFGQVASGSYFELLGLQPAAGRLLRPDDDRLDPPVAVIGHGYWLRRFGGAPDAIGRTLSHRDRAYTIVGVTPPRFRGLHPGREVDVTLPITQERGLLADGGAWWFEAVARLRPRTSREQAAAQADAVFQSYMKDRAGSAAVRLEHFDHVELAPAGRGLEPLRSRFARPLLLLTLVAGVVLLAACANLGSLLLARGAAREKELAIRLATGAGQGRLLRQLLTETLLLFFLGACAGLVVAHLAIEGLTGFFAVGRSPIQLDVHYDWKLAGFAAGIALAAGLLTGLWPALRGERRAAIQAGGSRLAGSRGVERAGRLLVTVQVALALVLAVTAALFVKTMANLRAVDLGFSRTQVLSLSLDPVLTGAPATELREQFWQRALERVRALPGVEAASLSVLTPLSGRDTGKSVSAPGFTPQSDAERMVRLNHVSEDYFRTFGVRLTRGRDFTRGDARPAAKVAILNETAARTYFGTRDPIGESLGFGRSVVYRVVGVVEDTRHRSLREPSQRFAYVPLWQPLDALTRITLAVSSAEPQAALARSVSREVKAIHPNTLVSDVIAVEDQIDATLLSERLLSTLATAFATLALSLSAIGLFGTLSYSVARRTAEFGVRMALGAGPARIAWSVVRETLLRVVAGLALGLPAALVASSAARALLFGVAPADPDAYLAAAAALTTVAGLAAWLPARRAASIDPCDALRRE